jgi:hypothetical protein
MPYEVGFQTEYCTLGNDAGVTEDSVHGEVVATDSYADDIILNNRVM